MAQRHPSTLTSRDCRKFRAWAGLLSTRSGHCPGETLAEQHGELGLGHAAFIFEETGELIGCAHIMAERAITPELGAAVAKAVQVYATLGYGSFAAGNAEGGLYLLHIVPDGAMR